MDPAELEKLAAEPTPATEDEEADEGEDKPNPMWDEMLEKMRALFREEIKEEIDEMNNDSEETTKEYGESELEALIDAVESKYFFTQEECEAWMERQHEKI
jgi:hypothetical protein